MCKLAVEGATNTETDIPAKLGGENVGQDGYDKVSTEQGFWGCLRWGSVAAKMKHN